MNILDDLRFRGLIHQTTDDEGLPKWLSEKPRTLYAGFDPTAESLHVGSLLPLLLLRRFQKAGHRPIALVGGATGMIGDPSGKSQERNLLSAEVLQKNIAGMRSQMQQFLDFDCPETGALLVNNHDWMGNFSYLEFLRDIGKNFPVNVMMSKDSVKSRLGRDDAGLSYTEFSYMLLQAYDFVHLHKSHGCELQIGGSDQWGNITAGIDLGRRMHQAKLFGLTSPLLTKADGTKMGKTETGAIWLSPLKTSPYQFYQYWINVDDQDAGTCLRMLTELSHEEILQLDEARKVEASTRASQRRLAEELTRLVHGEAGLDTAQRATQIFFGDAITNLNDAQLTAIFADVPSQEISRERLASPETSLTIIEALVESGLAKSNSDARRTVLGGGAYINNLRVEDPKTRLTTENLASETVMVVRSGKKKYALLRFSS